MRKAFIFSMLIAALLLNNSCSNKADNSKLKAPKDFLWGVASAAYQVEGAYQADGKGESKWDFFANKLGVTQFMIGVKQTGNIAINQYERKQYLQDIQQMKELGINTYRFSIAWTRILPQGTGEVNEKGIAHYKLLIKDLKDAGIEPMITLYHYDMPQVLVEKGGWNNPESVQWYKNYATVVFNNFGQEVKHFITFNEPYIEFFLVDFMLNPTQSKESANVRYSKEILSFHHELMASAEAIKVYHSMNLGGMIGITFNLSPCLPMDSANAADVKAVPLQDELLNRIVLDPVFKGKYPENALAAIQKYNPSFKPSVADMQFIATNKPDFLGVNFYAPAQVRYDENAPLGVTWMGNNTDSVKMNTGPFMPDQLYALLMRIKNEYNNPVTIITENGACFNNHEDTIINGKIKDSRRADYITRHIDAALRAQKDGVNLKGYCVWSGWDNFEWVAGYTIRMGLCYVDYKTQKRTPKQSYYTYQEILKQQKK
jgi:beta-glucosidase